MKSLRDTLWIMGLMSALVLVPLALNTASSCSEKTTSTSNLWTGTSSSTSTGTGTGTSTTTIDPPSGIIAEVQLTGGSESGYEVHLNWTQVTGADSYLVYRTASLTVDFELLTTVTVPPITDGDVMSGLTYYYKIVTNVGGKHSGDSATKEVPIVKAPVPSQPTGVKTLGGAEMVSIYWNQNPESYVQGYIIERSDSATGPWDDLGTELYPSHQYVDYGQHAQGTVPGNRYYYRVIAFDNTPLQQTSPPSNYVAADVLANPSDVPVPTGLYVNSIPGYIQLLWDDMSSAGVDSGYVIYRAVVEGGSVGEYSRIFMNSDPTEVSWIDSTIIPEMEYSYKVAGYDPGPIEGLKSGEVRSYDQTAPQTPTGFVVTGNNWGGTGPWHFSLNWNGNPELDLAGYKTYSCDISEGPYTEVGDLNGTSGNKTGWEHGNADYEVTSAKVEYFYRITSYDYSGNESVMTQYVGANNISPAAPTGVIAIPGQVSSSSADPQWAEAKVSWNPNSESDVYGSYPLQGKYWIYRDGVLIAKVNSDTSLYTDAGCKPATTYDYSIRVSDIFGNVSAISNSASVTTDPAT